MSSGACEFYQKIFTASTQVNIFDVQFQKKKKN